ncbi:poly(ADP-ribose) polymerase family member 14-related sequence 1 [Aulostomus maculatus]
MADAYSFALVAEFEENKIPRLRNKLVKYFQSKKASGGDCEVDYEYGRSTAVVRFLREQDQKNVLAKESHQIPLENGVLKMKVRLPADGKVTQETPPLQPSGRYTKTKTEHALETNKKVREVEDKEEKDEEAAGEETPCTSAVIENIPDTVGKEFLEMLVESILTDPKSKSTFQEYTLEVIPHICAAVVTFQRAKDYSDFLIRGPKNNTFMKKRLSVRPLEDTQQMVVEDIKNFNEDLLSLYFEKEGWDVESVVVDKAEQSAVITFTDHEAVHKLLKKKHYIRHQELKVCPFYKSLGTVLYGKDRPLLALPAVIREPIDHAVWRYLSKNPSAAGTIRSDLANHFCNVDLKNPSVILSPVSNLLKKKDAKGIIKGWADTVKTAFTQALSKFKPLKIRIMPEIFGEAKEEIGRILLNENLMLMSDEDGSALTVVGLTDDVNRLEQTLHQTVNKIVKAVERKQRSITQDIRIPQSIFHILCQDGLKEKLQSIYPDLKISPKEDSPDLMVTGLIEEIMAAKDRIYSEMFALKRRNLEMDPFVLELLKGEDQDMLSTALFQAIGISAVFEIKVECVQLLAVTTKHLDDAEDYLSKLLKSQYLDVEDKNVLKKPEWQHLISTLQNADKTFSGKISIRTKEPQVVVSGHNNVVERVCGTLSDFLNQNAHVEEVVVVKPNIIVEYIQNYNTSWLTQMTDKVMVSYRKEAICLSGSRVSVKECKTLVEDLVSSLFSDRLMVNKPGVKTFFLEKETMYVHSLMKETGCLVQLVDEQSTKDNGAFGQKFEYQIETPDGVEIAVCKADMCSYPVHAVVNASNQDLKHNGGLSLALLKAAGPQLQDECDKIIMAEGRLVPGDCVATGAGGKLCCKKVIHAVGPIFEPAKPQKSVAQLRRAVQESLKLAEKHGCISVALPAISRNQGFPLDLCAKTIVKAVKEHCDDNTLKRIHLVNHDDQAVRAMEEAVKQEFGNHGQSGHSTKPSIKAPKSLPRVQVGSDPNLLGQVRTKEGLAITLMRGNIEDATTEVIVNTLGEDLDLTKGAVSNAILRVAGPQLQQLLNSKSASGKVGAVLETDGCNLKSKQVFHAIVPHWKSGKGGTEKMLRDILKDCLGKAEDSGATSMSFSAIGTGKLGFPRDLAASIMFDEILAFGSAKKPKHLKKVVIVFFSGDPQTIQVFSDDFKGRFPGGSDGAVPSKTISKITSGAGMHEFEISGVAVQVVKGDITKEKADVIVNSTNESFSLKTGVSKAILDAAGQAVEDECQTLGAQPNTGMIMTNPGNLNCKKILHLVGRADAVQVNKVVKEALQMCSQNSYISVSFPAIGTGQGNVDARQVADAMLDAVIEVLNPNTPSTLKTIRIIIFQAPMLTEFYKSMQQKECVHQKQKGGFLAKLSAVGGKIKSYIVGENADKPEKEGDFIIDALEGDPSCFHICSDSQTHVDLAKQWINDLISKEYSRFTIQENTILSFSDEDHQRIFAIQKKRGVSIRIESKEAQASITIEGPSKELLGATQEIQEMLKRIRDKEELNRKVDIASTVADWQYQMKGLKFQSFDQITNFKLEEAWEKQQPTIKVTLKGQEYTVTIPNGPGIDKQGGTIEIKRIDKLKGQDVPEHWDTMPVNTTSLRVDIKSGTTEHTEILNLFQATCKLTVLKIERIQNPVLWKSLQIKKRDMEVRNDHQNNEKRLFHGTMEATVAIINERGFNRSFAGMNAAHYGNGTYFAVNASYSAHNTYSKPNANGEKFMYICRVLTGEFTTGKTNMIVPPAKGLSNDLYDSVVDNVQNPSIFVVFHDTQAYPEYLITFKQ